MELYLIRHTTPDVPQGVCYGQAEVDLAESFAAEVERIRAKLTGLAPAACYSSPLLRCGRLAAMLGYGEPRHDARLKELDFGAWELKPWDEIPRDALDRWGQAFVHEAPPGGETFAALHGRATAFLREVAELPLAGAVVVVTHAGVIRALLAEVLAMPLAEAFRFHLDYSGVTQLLLHGPVPSVGYVNR